MILCACSLLIASVGAYAKPAEPTFRVLLIGAGPYDLQKTGFVPLSGEQDMRRLEASLVEHWPQAKDHVVEVFGAKATKENILGALDQLVHDSTPADALLIAYSGHGVLVPDPTTPTGVTSSLVPLDVRRAKGSVVNESVITSKELRQRLLALDSKQVTNVTVIVDACESGGLARGDCIAKSGPNEAAVEALRQHAMTAATASPIEDELKTRNMVIIGAAKAGRSAYENPGKGGNLTCALIDSWGELLMPTKDNPNPKISYRDLFDTVQAKMANLPQSLPQEPQMILGDDRYLFRLEPKRVPSYALVSIVASDDPDRRIHVHTGSVFGVKKGYGVAIFRAGADPDAKGAVPIATAVVDSVGTVESILKLSDSDEKKLGGDLSSLSGGRATVTERCHDSAVRVKLAGKVPAAMSQSIAKLPYVEITSDAECDAVVVAPGQASTEKAFPPRDRDWLVYGADGNVVAPEIPDNPDPEIVEASIEDRLLRIAKRRSVLDLAGTTDCTVKVEMQLVPVELSNFLVASISSPGVTSTAREEKQYFALRVRAVAPDDAIPTNAKDALDLYPYIAVLDVVPSGNVQLLWPWTKEKPYPPGAERTRLRVGTAKSAKWFYLGWKNLLVSESDKAQIMPFEVKPKDGAGEEVFKLLATSSFEDFSPLLTVTRGDDTPKTRLGQLMQSFSAGLPVMRSEPIGGESSEWTVAQVTVHVVLKK